MEDFKLFDGFCLKDEGISRRKFVTGVSAGAAVYSMGLPVFGQNQPDLIYPRVLSGSTFNLNIGYKKVNFTGKTKLATTVNDSLPAPILRWQEGDTVTLNVTNQLAEDSSIHWHGIVLPEKMDGVPGISYKGIKPGQTFKYRFKVKQSGTFWYHSHSGFQEQTGLYSALIIDPIEKEPFHYDREYVVMLSDWSDEDPNQIYSHLKKMGDYYNRNERTLFSQWKDIKEKGLSRAFQDRHMWNMMRMSERDISDVTGYTYTFLMNGNTPENAWRGLFKKGEKIRLRFINSSAMTFFDIRIPGLKMKVVTADGNYIEPVSVDEFRIGVAETYDVIVEPENDVHTVFAQAMDRSGFALGVLSTNKVLKPSIPELDPKPVLTHADMGMNMAAMNMKHGSMNHDAMGQSSMTKQNDLTPKFRTNFYAAFNINSLSKSTGVL